MKENLEQFIDQIYIINLPEMTKRCEATLKELARLGIRRDSTKIQIPFAPRPADANGFSSRGVYGNFLSHIGILKDARDKGFKRILVLEDDAYFSKRFERQQEDLVEALESIAWDICFPGHSLKAEIVDQPDGLVRTQAGFMWAHCILVNHTILDRLIAYMEATIDRPVGDPLGGKMYIDGAYSMFRTLEKDVRSFVWKPVLSLQRRGPSSLGMNHWYDRIRILAGFVACLRAFCDFLWRAFS